MTSQSTDHRAKDATGSLTGRLSTIEEIRPLVVHKRLLLILTFFGVALTAAVALLLPSKYTGTALIMPPQQSSSMATAMAGALSPLASLAGRDLMMRTQADLYMGILRSRTIADALIAEFDLRTLYRAKTLTAARKALGNKTSLHSGKDNLIEIAVEDREPKRAADIANAYVDELCTQNSRLAVTAAAQRRLFFEGQVAKEKEALSRAEAALKESQTRTGILAATGQVDAVIGAITQLRAEIAVREVSLQRLQLGATPENPEIVRQTAEIAALRAQLEKLQSGSAQRAGDPVIPTSSVPEASLDYLRALRDLKYHEALFELLSQQYEAARIDEAKEGSIIQVVDRAVPPDKASWPPRLLLLILGIAASPLIAGGLTIFWDRLHRWASVPAGVPGDPQA
jgi:tyrosine-protein kinase Etk/Wzc